MLANSRPGCPTTGSSTGRIKPQYAPSRPTSCSLPYPAHSAKPASSCTPAADYLLHAQPLQASTKPCSPSPHTPGGKLSAGTGTIRRHANFQQRRRGSVLAAYRDLHRREVGSIAILRGLGAGPRDIFVRLDGPASATWMTGRSAAPHCAPRCCPVIPFMPRSFHRPKTQSTSRGCSPDRNRSLCCYERWIFGGQPNFRKLPPASESRRNAKCSRQRT